MKLACVIVAIALLGIASAAPAEYYALTDPMCNLLGYTKYDKSNKYQAGAGVVTGICTKKYYDACFTVDGVVPCNYESSSCVAVSYDWNNKDFNPVSAARMTDRPQVCISEGNYWGPETGVIAVAQPLISFIIGTFGFYLTISVARPKISILTLIFLIVQFIWCTFLFFSFYYLNALIALLVTYAAVGLIAAKDRAGSATAIIALVATLYWFTFQHGLGEIQHHSRFTKALTGYETLCNNYYRGYFGYPIELHGAYESPSFLTKGYCLREWLAAEYFFIINVKVNLLIFIALAAAGMRQGEQPQEEKKEEEHPALESQPAAASN